MDVKIESSWKQELKEEFDKPYFAEIVQFLKDEKTKGKIIYPPGPYIFNAFDKTPLENVKVVILGQDPYHGPNQAHGLSFSVQDGIAKPPSLVNIFKELNQDLGMPIPNNGNLTNWAKKGVLLLNASLTVEAHKPMSHSKIGWHIFTDATIRHISEKRADVVFMLWGGFARSKKPLIDTNKHLILEAPHPSPLSAHSGFLGCRHFSKANSWMEQKGLTPIDWQL